MIVTQRRLDSIRPYPGNPRRNDPAVEAVAKGLREWTSPGLVESKLRV